MTAMTGNAVLAQILEAARATHFFHVPVIVPEAVKIMSGLGVLPVVAHSEKAAAYMADGYARVARRPGFCGCQAIGATNLASGLRDAFMAGIPVVALTGGSSPRTRYRHPYQEIDDMPIYEALTKFNAVVEEADRLQDLLHTAIRCATTGTPGPVHIELDGFTGQVLGGSCRGGSVLDSRFYAVPALRSTAAEEDITRALEALESAARPIIVAGGGVRLSGAEDELCELARRLAIPVATSLSAKGCIVETDPLSVGVVGEYSRVSANKAVYEADLVFFIGSRTGGLVTRGWSVPAAGSRVIHLDINPENIGRNYLNTVPLCGDARTVLRQMCAAATSGCSRQSWLARVAALKGEWRQETEERVTSCAVPIRPEHLCWELSRSLPENAIVVGDTGHSSAWFAQFVQARAPAQRFIRCHGSLGWSFPAALGAKCAAPAHPVVCFVGDGGFYYHLAELETARRYGINVVTVLNDNSGFSQEQNLWPAGSGLDRNWKFGRTDFAAVASAMGCIGMRVTESSDLGPALVAAFAADRPVVLDVITDASVLADTGWGPEGQPALFSGGHE
jgi:acetolactate synthase-1/2/3 large subunit